MNKITFICIFLLLLSSSAWALNTGNVSASAASNSAIGANADWLSVNSALTSNDSYATTSVTSTGASDYLIVRGFDFSGLPDDATISGIQVKVEGYGTKNGANLVADNRIRLVNENGVVQTTDRSVGVWSTIEGEVTYGSATDQWSDNGETWTPAKLKDADFGVAISIQGTTTNGSKTVTAYVDNVRFQVFYTQPSTGADLPPVPAHSVGIQDIPGMEGVAFTDH